MLCYSSKIYFYILQQPHNNQFKEKEKSDMTKQQTAKTTTTETRNFTDLLRQYEKEYNNDKTSVAFSNVLDELATAVAYSVIKKCLDPQRKGRKDGEVSNSGCNTQLDEVKRSIYRDKNTLANIDYSCKQAFVTVYNEDGDRQTKTKDSDYRYAYNKLSQQTLGDGLDLVHVAMVALLDESEKADRTKENYLENTYGVRRLKKKVWIKSEDSVNGWETVETSPIKEVYKAVRREVANNRSLNIDPSNGYLYLEDLATDEESNEETTIYRRLNKFSDLAGNVTDFNGAVKFETVDANSVTDYDTMVEELELTARQTKILELRMGGYGYVAIATYLGVNEKSVRDVLKTVQKKAIEKLNLPEYLVKALTETKQQTAKNKLTDEDKKTIELLFADGHSMKFIADRFNVSKMTVSRVINGRKDR
jgi:DNA-binding NarL/FixJ family response regulator